MARARRDAAPRRRAAVLPLLALLGLLVSSASPVLAEEQEARPAAGVPVGEGAQRAAALVAAEDRRVTEIRTLVALARWQGRNWKTPFRVSSGSGYTLVLTQRAEPYTVEDLLALAPQTFLRLDDGSYLLTEHVVVAPRATLRLAQPGGLTVRLGSSPRGFVSLIGLGGRIDLAGEPEARVRIGSWNLDAGRPDVAQEDGRAYVRIVGGQFRALYSDLSDLGFWSGRTGGLSLTGTDRPNTGAIERQTDDPLRVRLPSLLDGVSTSPAGALAPGQINPTIDYVVPAQDFVTSRIQHVVLERSAYGLFVTGARGLTFDDIQVRDNSISGLVLHRHVTNALVDAVVATGNAGHGISVERASTGIRIDRATSSRNEGNGLRLSGRPLADGPSATGASPVSYGGNHVQNSTFEDNGHYGIEVLGGFDVGVQNNRVSGGDMGIVVDGPAERVSVTGNDVQAVARHGIAMLDGVTSSTVTGNVVDGASTGVYVRDASAAVRGNTVQRVVSHGISLVGRVDGAEAVFNVLAGSGPSALDSRRSTGTFLARDNAVDAWDDTTPWYFWFKKLLQPMTALWALIALLAGTSAVRGKGKDRQILHPYAHQMAHHGVLEVPAPAHQVLDLRDDRAAAARHA